MFSILEQLYQTSSKTMKSIIVEYDGDKIKTQLNKMGFNHKKEHNMIKSKSPYTQIIKYI
jgi:hypothetical protein